MGLGQWEWEWDLGNEYVEREAVMQCGWESWREGERAEGLSCWGRLTQVHPQAVQGDVSDVLPSQQHPAFGGIEESVQQSNDGRLAAAVEEEREDSVHVYIYELIYTHDRKGI